MMNKDSFLGYVPAITKNSLEMLDHYSSNDVGIFLIDPTEIAIKSLQKDFRALSPEIVKDLLSPRMHSIQVASKKIIKAVVEFSSRIYMPDDEVSRIIIERDFIDLNKITFDRTFFRWQAYNIPRENQVNVSETIHTSSLPEIYKLLESEKTKSLDPWRQVAAVLTDKEYNIILSSHNSYVPNEYSGEIDGDVRSNYSKGIMLEASNAIHAEASLVAEAAKQGVALEGKTLFVSTFPCPTCAKLISRTGLENIIFQEGYTLLDGQECLQNEGIKIKRLVND